MAPFSEGINGLVMCVSTVTLWVPKLAVLRRMALAMGLRSGNSWAQLWSPGCSQCSLPAMDGGLALTNGFRVSLAKVLSDSGDCHPACRA